MDYQKRLLNVIPAGAHTYSRGFDQFPENAPKILSKGKDAYIYDNDNNEYLDYGMALRAVNIGYANEIINHAAIEQIQQGNNLTRASMIELEAAELLVDLIESVDMVKFCKNGSTSTTAAVKLARAYTGKKLIVRCANHPFFSYDDWFIASTVMDKGTTSEDKENTKTFIYNDIESLVSLFDQYKDEIACVIMEPATNEHPKDGFLHKVQKVCKENGAVFVLDEMITGFRWSLGGAQEYYDIKPDLCTFGKAMANGFSVACIAGKREIMSLGSIEEEKAERLFLLSSTHGAEMCSLGAFVKTVQFMKEHRVIEHIWDYGEKLIKMMNDVAKDLAIDHSFSAQGIECSPSYLTLNKDGKACLGLRTLFSQEMFKNGVCMPWIALCYSHGDRELDRTREALYKSLEVYKLGFEKGYESQLKGSPIRPVFRRYN